MVKSTFILFLRSFKSKPFYNSINFLGLSLGIGVCLMLVQFVQHELSFDEFHLKKDRIHRVVSSYTTNNGSVSKTAISFGTLAPEVLESVPEVNNAVRILRNGYWDIQHNEDWFQDKRMLLTDDSFFDVFSFSSLLGPISTTDFNAGGIVISKKLAIEIFGEIPFHTAELKIENKAYPIVGIIEVPKTSHLQFDILKSGAADPNWDLMAYHSGLEFWTYLEYTENANIGETSAKVIALYDREMEEQFSDFTSAVHNQMQPFSNIHLFSEDISTSPNSGSITTVKVMSALAILVLGIAVINFINLSTVLYQSRLKEIGIRKVLGAQKSGLIKRFLLESAFISLISLLVAFLWVELAMPQLASILNIDAEPKYWSDYNQLAMIFLAAIALGFVSGSHPALVVSGFSPLRIVKGHFSVTARKNRATSALTIFQYSVSIILLVNLVYFRGQIDFLKNKPLGFTQKQVLVIGNLNEKLRLNYDQITTQLEQVPGIESASGTQSVPGQGASGQTIYFDGNPSETALPIAEIRTKHGFAETLGLSIIAGRSFAPSIQSDKSGFLLNKKAFDMLSPDGKSIIDKEVIVADRKGPVLGVFENYHFRSSKFQIQPLVISLDEPYRLSLLVKLNEGASATTIQQIEESLKSIDREYTFSCFFLDEFLDNQFKQEQGYSKIISWASILASSLSIIGLLALAGFKISGRIREAAIRKVLGARFRQIGTSMSKEFLYILAIANLIAVPLSIYFVNNWLNNYANRISVGQNWYWILIIVLAISTSTMALLFLEVYRRTNQNPAKVLKDE